LGTLGAGKVSVANAINSLGQIAGFSSTSDNSATHAVIWDGKGGIVDLGTLSGGINSYAYGINVQGAVVGSSQVQ
jgi:probable HAF family extracellular repeat protein